MKDSLRDENGSTMVEFAFSLGVFLMLLGGIVDLGVGMHRKSMLTHLNREISRLIAVRLAGGPGPEICSKIEETIRNDGITIAQGRLGINVNAWAVDWRSPAINTAQTNPSFNLSLSSQIPCFFLCQLMPNGITAESNVVTTVGNQGLICSDVRI